MKRYLSLILAVILIVVLISSCILMTVMSRNIADLQSQVNQYKPYYTSTLASTYGESGIVTVKEVLDRYENSVSMYSQYGISVDDYDMNDRLKLEILTNMTESNILYDKAVELGLDKLSDEELSLINSSVESALTSYVKNYTDYYYPDQTVTDLMKSEAEAYWAQEGFTRESYSQSLKKDKVLDNLQSAITADITVSAEDVRASYDSMLKEQKENFDSDSASYIAAVNDGDMILYHPEGYRNVNYILLSFDDDKHELCDDLNQTLTSLNAERASASSDPSNATRTLEAIDADITDITKELDDLYAPLTKKADEIISEFNAGMPFNELVQSYYAEALVGNEDGAKVYPVCSSNEYWESTFTEEAMRLEEPGSISKPVRSLHGLFIVYYDSETPAYTASFEDVKDTLTEKALNDTKNAFFDEQVEQWVDEASPVYYYENIGISAGSAEPISKES